MHRHLLLRRAGICAAVATVSLLALAPVKAETPGSATLPAARSAPRAAECRVTADQVRFDVPLVRTARLLAGGARLRGRSRGLVAAAATQPAHTGAQRRQRPGHSHVPPSSEAADQRSRHERIFTPLVGRSSGQSL